MKLEREIKSIAGPGGDCALSLDLLSGMLGAYRLADKWLIQ